MPVMPGLTIIVARSDPERFHAALSLAAANAALDQRSRLFLQGEAVRLLGPTGTEGGERLDRLGAPTVAELLEECLAMGVAISVCQTGLALAGMAADALPHGMTPAGLVEILSTRGDDQLLMA